MKLFKKENRRRSWLIVVMTVLLVLTGCSTPEQKLEKLTNQAKELIQAGNYDGAMEAFEKALNDDGFDHDAVIDLVRQAYDAWASNTINQDGVSYVDIFTIYQGAKERFPEITEHANNRIISLGNLYMDSNGNTFDNLLAATSVLFNYFEGDEDVRQGFYDHFQEKGRLILEENITSVAVGSLILNLNSGDFDKAFEDMRELREICKTAGQYIDFPVTVILENDQMLKAEFVNNSFTLYYGGYDNENVKQGMGIHLAYMVDREDPNKTIKQVIIGNFTDDRINGEINEVIEYNVDKYRVSQLKGNMVDSKYDGDILMKMKKSKDGEVETYNFSFNQGYARYYETYESNGQTYYVVGQRDNGDQIYYTDNAMNTVRGWLPEYRQIY